MNTYSGPLGVGWKPMGDMLLVWARDVNARGGIDGRPVQVLLADDGGDAVRHFSAVKDFVENRGVFAFIGHGPRAGENEAVVRYLEERGVPVVGGDLASNPWQTSSMFFPQGLTPFESTFAQVAGAVKMRPDAQKWGQITCREAIYCHEMAQNWPGYAREAGLSVVYRGEVSIAQPDFTAECLNAQQSGAQILAVAVDPNAVNRVAQACARQGYRPTFLLPSAAVSSGQDGDANLEGAIGVVTTAPWSATAAPGVRAMHDALATYAPRLSLSTASTMGWAAGKLFEAGVAAGAGLGSPPSRERLIDGLYKLSKGETLGGLSPPLAFERGQERHISCWFTLQFTDGAWKAANGGRHDCP